MPQTDNAIPVGANGFLGPILSSRPPAIPAGLAALIAVVMAVVVAVHVPVLSAQALCFDDDQFFAENPLVTNPSWQSVRRFFSEVLQPSTVSGYNNYMPVTMTSLMVDYAQGARASDLRQYHRTNLALHAANTALVILLLHGLLGQIVPAVLVGLLFGLHPLTVEPVAWVAERKGLLAAFFAWSSLFAYVQHANGGARRWIRGSLALYLLAVLSKPTAVVLPAVMLILDFWPLRRLRGAAIKEKLPFFAVAAVFVVITILSRGKSAESIAGESRLRSASVGIPAYIFLFYLRKIVWPVNLCCVYLLPKDLSLTNPPIGLSLLGTVGIAALTLVSLRRTRAVFAGMAVFLVAVAPTLGIVRYSWVTHHDKYVYGPVFGLLMVLAWAIAKAWEPSPAKHSARKTTIVVLVLVAAAAEAAGVRDNIPRWKDSVSLYEYMARLAPEAPVVRDNLGRAYFDAGRTDDAIREFRITLDLVPDSVHALNDLGIAFAEKGRLTEALELFQKAESIAPDDVAVQFNFGSVLLAAGRRDQAAVHLRRALELKPDHAKARQRLRLALGGAE